MSHNSSRLYFTTLQTEDGPRWKCKICPNYVTSTSAAQSRHHATVHHKPKKQCKKCGLPFWYGHQVIKHYDDSCKRANKKARQEHRNIIERKRGRLGQSGGYGGIICHSESDQTDTDVDMDDIDVCMANRPLSRASRRKKLMLRKTQSRRRPKSMPVKPKLCRTSIHIVPPPPPLTPKNSVNTDITSILMNNLGITNKKGEDSTNTNSVDTNSNSNSSNTNTNNSKAKPVSREKPKKHKRVMWESAGHNTIKATMAVTTSHPPQSILKNKTREKNSMIYPDGSPYLPLNASCYTKNGKRRSLRLRNAGVLTHSDTESEITQPPKKKQRTGRNRSMFKRLEILSRTKPKLTQKKTLHKSSIFYRMLTIKEQTFLAHEQIPLGPRGTFDKRTTLWRKLAGKYVAEIQSVHKKKLNAGRKKLNKNAAKKIFQRQGMKCALCNCTLNACNREIDHKRALKNGGRNVISNLHGVCSSCHSFKTKVVDCCPNLELFKKFVASLN